jgi:hypothetical protein
LSFLPLIFYIKKYKKAALGKIDRNCLVFANGRWKAIGQPLGTAGSK